MKYCEFNGCKFNFVEFRSSNFRGSRFKGAHFENVIFDNCDLSDTCFQGATFKNAYFINTSVKKVKGIKDTDLLTKISNHSLEITFTSELLEAINECKDNPYILSSKTIFLRKKDV